MNRNDFIRQIETVSSSATFLAVQGYTSEGSGECADYTIVYHMSYRNALVRSIAILESLVPDTDLDAEAKNELIASFNASIVKIDTVPVAEIDDAYTRFPGVDGVKMHTDSGTLHVFGMLVSKRTITPGVFKTVKSKPLTIAKDRLRKLTPVSKFRQFILKPEHVEAINVKGLHLLPPGSI